jgi:hypothetical protein
MAVICIIFKGLLNIGLILPANAALLNDLRMSYCKAPNAHAFQTYADGAFKFFAQL